MRPPSPSSAILSPAENRRSLNSSARLSRSRSSRSEKRRTFRSSSGVGLDMGRFIHERVPCHAPSIGGASSSIRSSALCEPRDARLVELLARVERARSRRRPATSPRSSRATISSSSLCSSSNVGVVGHGRTSSTRRAERAGGQLDLEAVARAAAAVVGARRLRRGRSRSRGSSVASGESACSRAPEWSSAAGVARAGGAARRGDARPDVRAGSRRARGGAHGEAEPAARARRAPPRARRGPGRRARRPPSASRRARRRRGRRAACPARARPRRRPGRAHAATARTTASSLKGRRSSKLPPPRASTTTSTSGCAASARERGDDRSAAPLPLNARLADDDLRRREARADRRDEVAARGRVRAGEDPDRARKTRGSGRLRSGAKSPSAASLPLQLLEREEVPAEAEALDRRRAEPELALQLVELGAAGDVHGLALLEPSSRRS